MEYTHTETFVSGNCRINIYRPVLTPEERVRRMDVIKKATHQLLVAAHKK